MPIDEKTLRSTTDARVWAEEFCSEFSIYTDEGVVEDKFGLMIGWFATAIEIGKQAGRAEDKQAVLDVVNLYGDATLHQALNDIGWP